jgi:hypothetical protein
VKQQGALLEEIGDAKKKDALEQLNKYLDECKGFIPVVEPSMGIDELQVLHSDPKLAMELPVAYNKLTQGLALLLCSCPLPVRLSDSLSRTSGL